MAERLKDITPPGIGFGLDQPVRTGTRAKALSDTLRKMAIKARGRNRFQFQSYAPSRRWEHSFNGFMLAAFVLLVVIPVAVAAVYLGFIMSDQYATETRFAVRGAERASFDPISSLTGIPSTARVQEANIMADYIRGRGIVEELDKSMNLREKFTGPGIDFLSRFDSGDPIEDLVLYWRWHVEVHIDALSGVVSLVVYAFSPEDALEISKAVLAVSERLINDLSERSRTDALRHTQSELKRAEGSLQTKIREMQALRNAEGFLDADKTSDALTLMLSELRLELIRMDREYNAQRRTVAAESPQLRVLDSRIRATREQIRRLEGQMTGSTGQDAPALSESMGRFERLKLEHDLAQKRYVAAAASFERARVDLSTQQIYLTTFVPPTLAQKSLYPRRLWIFTIVTLICLAIWGMVTGLGVVMRNHMA